MRGPLAALPAALLASGLLLAPDAARAQLDPQELLKQVLPGGGRGGEAQDRGEAAAAGERACERRAEEQGLEMRARVRGDRRDFTCLYDDDRRQALLAE